MRILIVDDSVVFRSQIRSALEASDKIEIVGVAPNGKVALQKLAQASVDLVTLDMEMPEMNGIETIKEIRLQKFPVRIVVFSSLTTRGSEATLEALRAGADDFIAKPSGPGVTFENSVETIRKELLPKVLQFKNPSAPVAEGPRPALVRPVVPTTLKKDLSVFIPSVIVIGCSTGGPPALELALAGLKGHSRVPILIAQHMPPIFTASLARRIESVTGLPTAEAKHGEELLPGRIYVAPGDFHMTIAMLDSKVRLVLDQGPPRNSVRPAVDPLFESAAKIFGPKVLSIVLTGMGEDGLVGARAVKEVGGGVLIQDKESCVVFGMPGSIYGAGVYDGIGDLAHINSLIKRMIA